MFRKSLECLAEPYRSIAEGLLRSLLRLLGDGLVSLVVYGSVARGGAGRDSDLDLLLVAEELPSSRLKRARLFMGVEEISPS